MLYMSDIIFQKVLKNATADNIESSLELFCVLVEKLKEVKRKFDNEAPTHPKACKERSKQSFKPTLSKCNFDNEPMKKLKIEILEFVSDDDSSSDYIPSSDESIDESEDDDNEDNEYSEDE